MTPLERYQRDLEREGFVADAAQKMAIARLQSVYEQLVAAETAPSQKPSLLQKLIGRKQAEIGSVRGLYFWGGVGRGKTYLMDIFFESLPIERKLRVHFHRFMQRVHRDLKVQAGQKNPLDLIARNIALETRVICFDEFFVSDITDAMILGGLFEKLFGLGVTLIATSNIVPDELYKDGLQRARFLPAIAQLKFHTDVINVDSGIDYRLRVLEQAELYHSPLDDEADRSLLKSFKSLASEQCQADQPIEIEGRKIASRYLSEEVVWFDFHAICEGPRSQNDYIELARVFHAVLVSNVPQMNAGRDDAARRFINMVDEFYDRNVKLVLSAAVPLAELYAGGRLVFEFQRTRSRLLEMQSHEYLGREHRP